MSPLGEMFRKYDFTRFIRPLFVGDFVRLLVGKEKKKKDEKRKENKSRAESNLGPRGSAGLLTRLRCSGDLTGMFTEVLKKS